MGGKNLLLGSPTFEQFVGSRTWQHQLQGGKNYKFLEFYSLFIFQERINKEKFIENILYIWKMIH